MREIEEILEASKVFIEGFWKRVDETIDGIRVKYEKLKDVEKVLKIIEEERNCVVKVKGLRRDFAEFFSYSELMKASETVQSLKDELKNKLISVTSSSLIDFAKQGYNPNMHGVASLVTLLFSEEECYERLGIPLKECKKTVLSLNEVMMYTWNFPCDPLNEASEENETEGKE